MKRILLIAGVCFLLIAGITATAETVTFRCYDGKLTVDRDCEEIDLGRLTIDDFDDFCAFLDQLPQLKRVNMYSTHMRKKNVARLFNAYPGVDFGMTIWFGDHTVTTDQTAFSTLHDGEVPRHTSSDFEVLKYCKNLQALDLGHNQISDLSWLEDMPQLRVLILADNEITDITALGTLKNLEYLEIFSNKITDFTPLQGCESLMDLNICYNRCHDLTPLYAMKQLKRLWYYNYDRSFKDPGQDVTEPLNNALPDTLINSTAICTEGGWRSHPHYDVIFRMFQTDTYMPFEDSAANMD